MRTLSANPDGGHACGNTMSYLPHQHAIVCHAQCPVAPETRSPRARVEAGEARTTPRMGMASTHITEVHRHRMQVTGAKEACWAFRRQKRPCATAAVILQCRAIPCWMSRNGHLKRRATQARRDVTAPGADAPKPTAAIPSGREAAFRHFGLNANGGGTRTHPAGCPMQDE